MRLLRWGRLALLTLLPTILLPSLSVAGMLELDFQLVIFERSGWTQGQVEEHLDRTREILAPCGIQLGKLDLISLDVAVDDLSVEFFFGKDLGILARPELSTLARPTIFFVGKLVDEYGWDMEPQFTWQSQPSILPQRRNTSWIGAYVESLEYRRYLKDPRYDPVAHEIGHLLGISRDVASRAIKRNLMGDGRDTIRDGSLTSAQCDELRKSPLLRPALP